MWFLHWILVGAGSTWADCTSQYHAPNFVVGPARSYPSERRNSRSLNRTDAEKRDHLFLILSNQLGKVETPNNLPWWVPNKELTLSLVTNQITFVHLSSNTAIIQEKIKVLISSAIKHSQYTFRQVGMLIPTKSVKTDFLLVSHFQE